MRFAEATRECFRTARRFIEPFGTNVRNVRPCEHDPREKVRHPIADYRPFVRIRDLEMVFLRFV